MWLTASATLGNTNHSSNYFVIWSHNNSCTDFRPLLNYKNAAGSLFDLMTVYEFRQ